MTAFLLIVIGALGLIWSLLISRVGRSLDRIDGHLGRIQKILDDLIRKLES